MNDKDFFLKSNRILQIIFIFLFLLIFRIWHLCAYQKEAKRIEATRPQRRVLLQKAERGTIRDRFDLPLAMNRIRYHAVLYYGEIMQLPKAKWVEGKDKKKIKIYPRKDYISQLVKFLSKELKIDEQYLEDQIYAKASLFPHAPFILKENISEKTYYRLCFLEKNWPGVHAEIASVRYYPRGNVASTIIGTMGAIDLSEFLAHAAEIRRLERYLKKQFELEPVHLPSGYQSNYEVLSRLKELKEKSYKMNDLIGKYGMEKKFEQELRGIYGKKSFEVDVLGSFIRELPIHCSPVCGKNLKLTISAELQEFAEKLLAAHEKERTNKSYEKLPGKKRQQLPEPWVKGGAIVVMDPTNGEILTLATHPNFDPNDFIPTTNLKEKNEKQKKIEKWLETEKYIGDIWDGKEALTKKYYNFSEKKYETLSKKITWENFLENFFPITSNTYFALQSVSTIEKAVSLQEDMETIIYFSTPNQIELLFDVIFFDDNPTNPKASLAEKELLSNKLKEIAHEISEPLQHVKTVFKNVFHNKDKLLIIDLLRLAVFSPSFSDQLIQEIGELSLSDYHRYGREVLHFITKVKNRAFEIFNSVYFCSWRKQNITAFLKEKRLLEKKNKTYARPYTDYLEKKRKELFNDFWKTHHTSLLKAALLGIDELKDSHFSIFLDWHEKLRQNDFENRRLQTSFDVLYPFFKKISPELVGDFIKTIRSFSQLNRPLFGRYRKIKNTSAKEKDLAALFYPHEGCGYMRSYAFQCPAPQGSIFKIVTAYEALRQQVVKGYTPTNPLIMTDKIEYDGRGKIIVGYKENGKPYPRMYKKGRLPRSSHYNMGTIDLLSAMEQSSNPYFSILASDCLSDPQDLFTAAKSFGFGEKTGIDLIGEYKGNLPMDLKENRTGLYSFAIGHHTLNVTPLQTALFLSCIANNGNVYQPKILLQIIGNQRVAAKMQENPFQNALSHLGIQFPIFSLTNEEEFTTIQKISSVVKQKVFFPKSIQKIIFEGMDRVINGAKGTARPGIIKSLWGNPILAKEFKETALKMIGKTSTAEISYAPYVAASERAKKYKHIWFCTIGFQGGTLIQNKFQKPELVVVVYLPFGDAGKEAAPMAAQIIRKWKEVRSRAGM